MIRVSILVLFLPQYYSYAIFSDDYFDQVKQEFENIPINTEEYINKIEDVMSEPMPFEFDSKSGWDVYPSPSPDPEIIDIQVYKLRHKDYHKPSQVNEYLFGYFHTLVEMFMDNFPPKFGKKIEKELKEERKRRKKSWWPWSDDDEYDNRKEGISPLDLHDNELFISNIDSHDNNSESHDNNKIENNNNSLESLIKQLKFQSIFFKAQEKNDDEEEKTFIYSSL